MNGKRPTFISRPPSLAFASVNPTEATCQLSAPDAAQWGWLGRTWRVGKQWYDEKFRLTMVKTIFLAEL